MNILIVEDRDLIREILLEYLKETNSSCDEAVNGLQAIELVRKNTYDIIFMDLQMPILNGFEATKQILQLNSGASKSNPRIIALTADCNYSDSKKMSDIGFSAVLAKPIRKNQLLDCLQNIACETFGIEFQRPILKESLEDEISAVTLDVKIISDLRKIGLKQESDFFGEMIELFSNRSEALIEDFKDSLRNRDLKNIKKNAHALAGSSAMIGANKLYLLCRQVENGIKSQEDNWTYMNNIENERIDVMNALYLIYENESLKIGDLT